MLILLKQFNICECGMILKSKSPSAISMHKNSKFHKDNS